MEMGVRVSGGARQEVGEPAEVLPALAAAGGEDDWEAALSPGGRREELEADLGAVGDGGGPWLRGRRRRGEAEGGSAGWPAGAEGGRAEAAEGGWAHRRRCGRSGLGGGGAAGRGGARARSSHCQAASAEARGAAAVGRRGTSHACCVGKRVRDRRSTCRTRAGPHLPAVTRAGLKPVRGELKQVSSMEAHSGVH